MSIGRFVRLSVRLPARGRHEQISNAQSPPRSGTQTRPVRDARFTTADHVGRAKRKQRKEKHSQLHPRLQIEQRRLHTYENFNRTAYQVSQHNSFGAVLYQLYTLARKASATAGKLLVCRPAAAEVPIGHRKLFPPKMPARFWVLQPMRLLSRRCRQKTSCLGRQEVTARGNYW